MNHSKYQTIANSLLNLHWHIMDSPCGTLILVGNDTTPGFIAYRTLYIDTVLHNVHAKNGVTDPIKQLAKQLKVYFTDKKQQIIKLTEKLPGTEKERSVYKALCTVPFGKTISYSQLAAKAGLPGASRFVGTCMAKNPFPIIIPCHRVIKNDGKIGNYTGGIEKKECLLRFESIL